MIKKMLQYHLNAEEIVKEYKDSISISALERKTLSKPLTDAISIVDSQIQNTIKVIIESLSINSESQLKITKILRDYLSISSSTSLLSTALFTGIRMAFTLGKLAKMEFEMGKRKIEKTVQKIKIILRLEEAE